MAASIHYSSAEVPVGGGVGNTLKPVPTVIGGSGAPELSELGRRRIWQGFS